MNSLRSIDGRATLRRIQHATMALSVAAALVACGGGGGGSGGGTLAPSTYTIGGSISGLTTQGLVLANGPDAVAPIAGATNFLFATPLAAGAAYLVQVQLQPDGLTCSVSGGAGTVGTANVTDVQVTCVPATFAIGGTITGLTASGLVLANGADTVSPVAGSTVFVFPTKVTATTAFSATVMTQPVGETCQIANGSGVVLTSAVTNIAVTCM